MPASTDPRRLLPASPGILLGLSIAALTSLSLARANATAPDLGPRSLLPSALLPWAPTPAVVTAVMWAGYALGALGLAWAWHERRGIAIPAWLPAVLAAVALLGVPIGSADHLNYAAYGRIALQGGNPWVVSPIDWGGGADPVTSHVEAPWTTTPTVYGPFITGVHAIAALLGGESVRAVVWWWQLAVVLGWLGVRYVLLALVPAQRDRIDLLWTVNPLIWSQAVLGAHVDTVATVLVLAAAAAVGRRVSVGRAAASGALIGAAGSTKFTYAVAGLAVAWAISRQAGSRQVRARVLLGLAAGFVLVTMPLYLWTAGHAFDQVARSRSAVSLATPWRLVLEALRPVLGNSTSRALISVGAAVLALVLLAAFLRLTRPVVEDDPRVTSLWLIGALTFAYVAAAPYSLPWYDLLVWAALPVMVGSIAVWLNGIRLLVLACAYVPGRVSGLTPDVEDLTLGFRRGIAPWIGLALWGAWVVAAWVRSDVRPWSGPGRGPRH